MSSLGFTLSALLMSAPQNYVNFRKTFACYPYTAIPTRTSLLTLYRLFCMLAFIRNYSYVWGEACTT
jgi:hypothetical protein